jgi:hypothetical protein
MFALSSILFAATVMATPPATPPQAGVRINLNSGGDYRPGDRVSVEVETDDDGYLVVFRVDGDGYVRVIFPLDPDLDPFVRGDRRYELRGRGERQSFLADDRGGTGLVLAVLSRSPLDFRDYAYDSHWDYERLRLDDPAGDAEAQLLEIARRMSRDARFDYDVTGYRVWGPGYESDRTVVMAGGGYDPYFDPSYSCLACGWGAPRTGVSITIGGHYGGWSDPWYDPWYDPWRYRYDRYHNWNGWWGWDPYWGTPWRPITVINTPPRPVAPNPIYGVRSRPRQPGEASGLNGVPRLTDPVGGSTRPPTGTVPRDDGRSRARGSSTTPTAVPSSANRPTERSTPARRAPTSEAPRRDREPARGSTSSPPPPPPPPSTERSRSRRPEAQQLTPVVRPAVEPRRVEERPVYRPPVESPRVERRPEPSASSRPTSSPPPRSVERRPHRESSERSSPPTRTVERSSPPPAPRSVERSSPRSSPPTRTVERSSPPSSPPAGKSSGSSRSRSRGNN